MYASCLRLSASPCPRALASSLGSFVLTALLRFASTCLNFGVNVRQWRLSCARYADGLWATAAEGATTPRAAQAMTARESFMAASDTLPTPMVRRTAASRYCIASDDAESERLSSPHSRQKASR